MPLSNEERFELTQKITGFDTNPSYAFLAEKKLLPQQRGIESFEDAPVLTQMRRSIFGMTNKEQQLLDQQQSVMVPFQQEQQIKNEMFAKLNAAKQFAMQQPIGDIMRAFPGAIQPDESQMRDILAPLTAQTMQPPNVGAFSEAGPNNPAGRLLQGPPQLMPTNAPPEADSSQQFTYQFPTQPIRELDPNATVTAGQLPLVQQLVAGHLTAPGSNLVPPTLQAERERTAMLGEQAQSPMGKVLADFKRTPMNSPAAGVLLKQMEAQLDPEALQTFKGSLDLAGIQPGTPQYKTAMTNFVQKQSTHRPGTQVTIPISTEKKFGEVFSTKIAESDVTLMDAAQKAPDLAERSNRIRQVLESGKIITGTGADFRLQAAKAFKLAGLSAGEGVEETETLGADLASSTLDAIKASGLGGGTGFSNADRDFLEKAKGGKITLEAGTLKRLADLAHRAAQKSAERWNTRSKQIPKSAIEGTGLNVSPITVPPLYGTVESGTVAKFDDPEKERRYQEYKKQHK